jgi:micrococcal nuclease
MRISLVAAAAVAVVGLAGCGASASGVEAAPASARAAAPGPSGPVPTSVSGQVIRVVDGDTVRVHTVDDRDLDIRVIGENSPETVDPFRPVECFGPQASAEAHRVLDNQTVTVVADYSQGDANHNDKYGRPLRYIHLPSGEDLSRHMVAGGFSRAYKVRGPAPAEWKDLVADQAQARLNHVGLWAPRPVGCGGGR